MSDRHTLQAALECHQASGDLAAQADTLMQLAKLAHADEEYSIAQGLYGQAWAIYEEMGDTLGIAMTQFSIGRVLNFLFWVYRRPEAILAEFNRGDILHMHLLALAQYKALDDKLLQAEVYQEMGHEAFDETAEDNTRARQCYQQALNCYEMLEDVWGEVSILNDLADTYDNSQPQKKLFLERALRLYQRLGEQRREGILYHELGVFAEHEKEYKQARTYYEAALETLTQVGDEEWLKLTKDALAELIEETPQQTAYRKDHEALFKRFSEQNLPFDHDIEDVEKFTPSITQRYGPARARDTYRRFLTICIDMRRPELQCRLYWAWGRMEYCFARQPMGNALCQRAVMLFEHHFPHLAPHYQQQLDEMRQSLIESQNPSQ